MATINSQLDQLVKTLSLFAWALIRLYRKLSTSLHNLMGEAGECITHWSKIEVYFISKGLALSLVTVMICNIIYVQITNSV